MQTEKTHIVPYRIYIFVLLGLLFLTFLTVAITSIQLSGFTVAAALILASMKTFLVLTYFMHLKFDKRYIRVMVGFVFAVFLVLIITTFFDYYYR